MIVLTIAARGHCADVRWAGAEAVLGSASSASIRREDAAWAPREAVLLDLGDRVLVVRSDGSGETRLGVGDSTRVGEATVTLVGIAPLAPERAAPAEEQPPAPVLRTEPAPTTTAYPDTGWRPVLEDDVPAPKSKPAASPALSAPTPRAERAAPAKVEPPRSPTPAPQPPPFPRFDAPATAATRSDPPASPLAGPAPAAAPERPGKPPAWHVGRFEDELLATLVRAPWFALSAAIHAVLVAALLLVSTEPEPKAPEEIPYGISSADSLAEHPSESGGPAEAPDPDLDPAIEKAPEIAEEPEMPEEAPDFAPSDPAPPGLPAEMPTPDDDSSAPPVIVGPSPSSWSRRKGLSKPADAKPSGGDETVNLDPDRGLDTAKRAAARVRDRSERGGGALGRILKGLRNEDIVVVRGSFDRMETVLETLRVPYVLSTPFEAAQKEDWSRHKLVFWNCGELMVPPRLRPKLHAALREFVRGGGYLFTTDWAISTIVEPCFPGYLKSQAGQHTIPEMVTDVRPADGARDHPFLEHVFDEGATKMTWWLENSSFDVQVADKQKVEVLLEAPALGRMPGSRSNIVAATFPYGRGRVLHLLGHYFQQKGSVAGAAGAQFIALNFVKMRLERDGATAETR